MSAKKVLAIHDMSAVGRCSLTVISPVLSAKGIQCVPLATTVLSSHYGGFGNVARVDLTDFCFDSLKEFNRIRVKFDCIYAGFLANETQIDLVKKAYNDNKTAYKICDPVMGDNGRIYTSVTPEITEGFKSLCAQSDLITPNTTEAQALLGESIEKQIFSIAEIEDMAVNLKEKYNCAVVITGAKTEDGKVINCTVEKDSEKPFIIVCNYLPVHFPGTGDLFCATMTAEILNGESLGTAVEKAARFVEICVKNTYYDESVDTRLGVEVEQNLKYLFI